MELRTYQQDAINIILSNWSHRSDNQLIMLPTGCGKTALFLSLIDRMGEYTALILAPSIELLKQTKLAANIWCPQRNTGILGVDDCEECDLIICTNSMASQEKRMEFLKSKNIGLIIVDEAHHVEARTYQDIIKTIKPKYVLGVTATPQRGDGKGLKNTFPVLACEKNIVDMIGQGWLCPLKCIEIKTKIDISSALKNVVYHDKQVLPESYDITANNDMVFDEKRLTNIISTNLRNQLIVDSWIEKCHDRKHTIAFCVDVNHAISLAKKFNEAGIPSEASYCALKNEDREKRLEDFKNGKIKILTNFALYTEGFDFPPLDCILMARPTKSESLYTQCVGRGTRKYPGKENCLIMDYRDDCDTKLVTFAELNDRNVGENNFGSQEGEKQPELEVMICSDGSLIYKSKDLLDQSPGWHKHPATQKQINYLKEKLNLNLDWGAITKGEAFNLINEQGITKKQKYFLHYKSGLRVKVFEELTKWEASKLIGVVGKPEFFDECEKMGVDYE